MADLVRFTLDDGSEVFFEAEESADLVSQHSGGTEVTDGGPLAAKLSRAAAAAQAVAETLRDKLSPDELSVELGFKLTGGVNWFFASNTAESNIKVTLTWSAATRPPGGDGTVDDPAR